MHADLAIKLAIAEKRDLPFKHLFVTDVLSPINFSKIDNWLSSESRWRLSRQKFYEQYEMGFPQVTLPKSTEFIVSPRFLGAVIAGMSKHFQRNFLSRVEVAAMKLTCGQGIGLHSDISYPQRETHRLIMYFGSEEPVSSGGNLVIFSGPTESNVAAIFPRTPNSAIAFEISNHSYHAVSEVVKGNRLSLVFSLTSV
jgi:Rps23 Pro-64 3,4-dihydroxylase Tpa1-like proline 4-hydroxylase